MKHKGLLFVISGFSGVGKGTLMKELVKRHDQYALSVSMTTREPRGDEVHGKDYYFITKEQFEENVQKGKMIEYAQYCDNYYGSPKDFVVEQLAAGKDVILEIELQGARKVKKQFPDAVHLFVMPPSVEALHQRLAGRGSESEEVIRKRLLKAKEESVGIEECDYVIINDVLEECLKELHEVLVKTHEGIQKQYHPDNYKEFIAKIREELNDLVKGEK